MELLDKDVNVDIEIWWVFWFKYEKVCCNMNVRCIFFGFLIGCNMNMNVI